ncbi:PC-Esterase [Dillenia turbinata]|uniref:PC-Esterase n=1 Tax=Dillenia turbinata TaxID=194707 RepID=A0AAN8VNW9_9MAGN
MDAMSSFKVQHFTLIKLFAWTLYALFAGAFLCLYLCPLTIYQPFKRKRHKHQKKTKKTKFINVSTRRANGSKTIRSHYTMIQVVVQSKMAVIASAMEDLTRVISIGSGNQINGIEKYHFNTLYVDYVDEKRASDLDHMDMVVLVAGQWLLLSAVYYEAGLALGCHFCPGLNHTEIGFYDAYGKVLRTSLKSIIERGGNNSDGKPMAVLVVTFPPAHFEGEWDKFGVCPKTKPYEDGEKTMGSVDEQMRKIGIGEVEFAKEKAKQFGNVRLEILDVTKLAFMRPDGHPGPYMFPFPFAKGSRDRVPNDCIHWCMPGPIDTWNEILLEMIKRWKAPTHR